MTTYNFRVVDPEVKNMLPATRPSQNPLVPELEKGEALFVEATPRQLQGFYQLAQKRGFKATIRRAVENKVEGSYIWWTKGEGEA